MPRGGKRPGAGRPKGSRDSLARPFGAILRVAGLRIPPGTDEQSTKLANEALESIVAVMRAEVGEKQAGHVLKASIHVREEICGPLKQRIEHSFAEMTDEQLEVRKREIIAKELEPEALH